ncbi:hypothetical protein AAK706_12105 [Erysipelotrichaceae bacterium 66-17]
MRKELCLSAILCLSSVMIGCSQQEEPKTEVKEPVEEEKKYDLTIGKQSDDALEVVLKNETGLTIKNLQITGNIKEDDNYSDNLLAKDEELKEGETAQWFYVPEDSENKTFDIKIGFDDDSSVILHDFSFENIDSEAVLHVDNGIGYITYTDKDKQEVSTLDAEKEASQTKEEKKPKNQENEITEQAPAQESINQEPVYQEPNVQEPVYQEPVVQEPVYQEPVVQPQPEVPSQGSEGCLGGDIEILN